ncbi:MAG: heavy metal translocating P-type ATPase [Nitrospirae bacterium]|nr:heavy metal translocating P-type ATPase [Nitrospirota bacterium]
MQTCDHCLLQFPDREAVYGEIKGRRQVFCCHGCMGIFSLINDEGLEEFYEKRDSWLPGPASDKPWNAAAFTEHVRQAGNELETEVVLDGIRCASCVWLNEKVLDRTKGVTFVSVNYATHRARIRWRPEDTGLDTILRRIASIGYTPKPPVAAAYEEDLKAGQKDLLIRLGTASFFSMQLMLYSTALYAGYFQGIDERTKDIFHLISLMLTTPVLFYSGFPFINGAARGLRNRVFNMDLLIVTGAGSAYLYSMFQMFSGGKVYFDTAAMIITLILLGRYIEAGAKSKASQTIIRLLSLSPKEAKKIKGQGARSKGQGWGDTDFETVLISSIKPGELIQVAPGEKIPLDGIMVSGSSEVDESMLTGESRPVSKTEGAEVFCGTQNLYGNIIFEVNRTSADTVLSQIIKVVGDAQARRAPFQMFADRVVGFFVPSVLLLSIMTFAYRFLNGSPATEALMISISVLVIACPCALGLATPLAVLAGTTRAASKGILIKGGDVIEIAKNIDLAVLDKTGTITEGRPLPGPFMTRGLSETEALSIAASLERHSEHSIGKAIAGAAKGLELHEVTGFTAHPGKGVKGEVNGKIALIGNRSFLESEGIDLNPDHSILSESVSLESAGATVVYLSYDGEFAGIFSVSDAVRKEAAEAVRLLQQEGLDVEMITGDNGITASAAAKDAWINEVKARMSPVEKAGEIKRMQDVGRHVMMVGDGINDAPALVQADIGIAMGKGTDIALESSDMVLMRDDLRLLPEALSIAKKTFSVIRQNIFWAFFYNVLAIPLAITGVLHPIAAAGAMAFSSLSVVGNSLRLLRIK